MLVVISGLQMHLHLVKDIVLVVISGLQMYLHLVKVLEDNYPEMMKRMFVVNGKLLGACLILLFRWQVYLCSEVPS